MDAEADPDDRPVLALALPVDDAQDINLWFAEESQAGADPSVAILSPGRDQVVAPAFALASVGASPDAFRGGEHLLNRGPDRLGSKQGIVDRGGNRRSLGAPGAQTCEDAELRATFLVHYRLHGRHPDSGQQPDRKRPLSHLRRVHATILGSK